ncbi:hypothetical protein AB7008_47825 [Bradyrhizobium sp. 521_C7_N1_3]|uniref:hypothetical protein n=1 Tax=Bradyrhizobium sp. 521_C7_N1_3 TaxID=3240368 RepID=UPI003F8C3786
MVTSNDTPNLQADKPKVIVLGDPIVDCHIYDMRAEDADQWLAWTSPLSRDDWHYAAGFDMRQCLAGAAGIHALLAANGIAVAGNSFPISNAFASQDRGSIFVLRRRSNAGKTKEERTRTYLTKSPSQPWREIFTTRSNEKVAVDRDETWRAAANLLSKSGVPYVPPFTAATPRYDCEAVEAVCFWDTGRGFFRAPSHAEWEMQQEVLFERYEESCKNGRKPPILIRTADPGRFAQLLKKLAAKKDGAPMVVLICALAQIRDGDLRGSGTWSGVWSQTYDYLRRPEYEYLFDATGNDWRFNIVIPVYEDGVIWIGPGCWPIEAADRKPEYLREDTRPLGQLFLVPGTQPGLSDFEQHSRIIGAHALLTYGILEDLAESPKTPNLALAIRKGLMRCKRLRSHGYCEPDELVLIGEEPGTKFHLNYPPEIWSKQQREATDLLLEVKDEETGQSPGPYEVICMVQWPEDAADRSSALLRIFRTIEKQISEYFVASPENCYQVVKDVGQDKEVFDRLKLKFDDAWKADNGHGSPISNDHWTKIKNKPCPLDSFAKDEIQSFWLRQRISMQFGNFAMANPKDAAPMLDLAQRIRQHVLSHRHNEPEDGKVFNFALFGSPGSGKSFLSREIARLIDSKNEIFNVDEFNLSQFTEEAQLTRALDTIASKSVGGKVPLVLWDEFDSVFDGKRGGWLARFLMPMQDAHFFDGRLKRPIGTAVFVFIGGTFPTADEFRIWACRTTKPGQGDEPSEAVLLKARDFHSRLYTALDMPGIIELYKQRANEKGKVAAAAGDESCSPGERCQVFRTAWRNDYSKLARAVLLREFFRNGSKIGKTVFLKAVEDDLCKFLLAIPLRHGARSLQRIVEACLVSKPSRVSMLHLPPPHFLEEHIETENINGDGVDQKKMTIQDMLEACRR